MNYEGISRQIATKLSAIWELHKHPEEFNAYIDRIYHRTPGSIPIFDCVYVAECEEGDVEKRSLGGIISTLWAVDDTGVSLQRRIDISENEEDEFYKRPIVTFFVDGAFIIVGERLGPQYISRKIGRVSYFENEPAVSSLQTVWTSDTL